MSQNAKPMLFGFGSSSSGQSRGRSRGRASSNNGGLRRGGGLMLALSSSASAEGARNSEESEFGINKGVHASEEVVGEGLRGRAVYMIQKRATGAVTGVRKIVYTTDERRGYYDAVRNEAAVYEDLQATQTDWPEHILPFRQAIRDRMGIILDFDWVDGADLETYFETATATEKKIALDHTARQLRWLAQAGYRHGDIKADNMYRAADGRILLFDFDKANKHMTYKNREHDRRQFMELLGTHVSSNTRKVLADLPREMSLADFYLRASRLIRREARPSRIRTRRHRRSSHARARTQRRSRY